MKYLSEYRDPEPVDLLQGILMLVKQLEAGEYRLGNQYTRVVKPEGNAAAHRLTRLGCRW